MPTPTLTYEGSQTMASIVLRLHGLFGDATMNRADVSTVIQEVEDAGYEGERRRRHLDEGIASLVRCGVVEPVGSEEPAVADHFALTERAATFAADRFAVIEREIERLAKDFEIDAGRTAEPPSSASDELWDIDRTSRAFLEDALGEADIPSDLLEMVVRTYVQEGRIQMSEDGRRYVIRLRPESLGP